MINEKALQSLLILLSDFVNEHHQMVLALSSQFSALKKTVASIDSTFHAEMQANLKDEFPVGEMLRGELKFLRLQQRLIVDLQDGKIVS